MQLITKLIFGLLVLAFMVSGCTRSSSACKQNMKKARKNNIGWQY